MAPFYPLRSGVLGDSPSKAACATLPVLLLMWLCSAKLRLALRLLDDDDDELPIESADRKGREWPRPLSHQRGDRGLLEEAIAAAGDALEMADVGTSSSASVPVNQRVNWVFFFFYGGGGSFDFSFDFIGRFRRKPEFLLDEIVFNWPAFSDMLLNMIRKT